MNFLKFANSYVVDFPGKDLYVGLLLHVEYNVLRLKVSFHPGYPLPFKSSERHLKMWWKGVPGLESGLEPVIPVFSNIHDETHVGSLYKLGTFT